MAELPITVAFWDYDRTAPLADGRVPIAGCAPQYLQLRPQETFVRAFSKAEFDICELSLSRHAQAVAQGRSSYVGLPIFLSRSFRHGSIYVGPSVARPEDLRGKRIGLGNFDDTAAVVVRALLREEFGVTTRDVTWVVGDVEPPFRSGLTPTHIEGLSIELALRETSLDDLLLGGNIDALIALVPPPSFRRRDPRVRRLFEDWAAAERQWHARRGIFPIMHVVGVRQSLVAAHPWLVPSVYEAFCEARNIALANLSVMQAPKSMLPWLVSEYERTCAVMGADFWPYGVPRNRDVLDWSLRQLAEDGLIGRNVQVDELFHAGGAPILEERHAAQLS